MEVNVYLTALSALFEEGPLALSGNPDVTTNTSTNAIGKLVDCKYHELSLPRKDFPHWVYGNNSMAFRNSLNSLCV